MLVQYYFRNIVLLALLIALVMTPLSQTVTFAQTEAEETMLIVRVTDEYLYAKDGEPLIFLKGTHEIKGVRSEDSQRLILPIGFLSLEKAEFIGDELLEIKNEERRFIDLEAGMSLTKTDGEGEVDILKNISLPMIANENGAIVDIGYHSYAVRVEDTYGKKEVASPEPKSVTISSVIPTFNRYFQTTTETAVYDNSQGKLVQIGTLLPNEYFEINRDYGANWHEIQFGGKRAYVAKVATKPASTYPVTNKAKVQKPTGIIVATEDVMIYDNTRPNLGLVPFATIKKDVEYPFIRSFGANWYEVQVGDRIGYVSKSRTKQVPPANSPYYTAKDAEVPLYESNNGQLVKVAVLKKGNIIRIVGDYGADWYKLQYGHTYTFVNKREVERTFGDGLKNVRTDKAAVSGYIQTLRNDLPVFDNSSGSLVPFLYLKEGQIISYVRTFGANWYEVRLGDRVGYVSRAAVMAIEPYKVIREELAVYGSYTSATDYRLQTDKVATLQYGDTVGVIRKEGYTAEVLTMSGKRGWVYLPHIDKTTTNLRWIVREGRNLRKAASSQLENIGYVKEGTIVTVLEYSKGSGAKDVAHWYKVQLANGQTGWIWGAKYTHNSTGAIVHPYEVVSNTMNVNRVTIHTPLLTKANVTAAQINAFLDAKTSWHLDRTDNMMIGMGEAFIQAAEETGVNVLYLVSHAALETGWGTSIIAKDKFNYFGIAAYDRDPYGFAYTFDSKENGIREGARWIKNNYHTKQQDTLYSMRINHNYHQYATDEAWHIKIANITQDFSNFIQKNR